MDFPKELYLETLNEMIHEKEEKISELDNKLKIANKELIKGKIERMFQTGIECEDKWQKLNKEKSEEINNIKNEIEETDLICKKYKNYRKQCEAGII